MTKALRLPTPTTTISPIEALRRILAGELVIACDLQRRLDEFSHFTIPEDELLNPRREIRKDGLPVVFVEGMSEIPLFNPRDVHTFMRCYCSRAWDRVSLKQKTEAQELANANAPEELEEVPA